MPDWENCRISARVPRRRGEWSSSIVSLISAWPSSVILMPFTLPTGTPPHLDGVALHDLAGVEEARRDLVAAAPPPPKRTMATSTTAAISAPTAATRPIALSDRTYYPYSSRTVPALRPPIWRISQAGIRAQP